MHTPHINMLHPIEIIAPTLNNEEWFARMPLLPGCMTQAPDLETLQENITEAKRLWIEAMLEDKQPIPEPE
jgi:predicted RNase H-like HicB family nuclease